MFCSSEFIGASTLAHTRGVCVVWRGGGCGGVSRLCEKKIALPGSSLLDESHPLRKGRDLGTRALQQQCQISEVKPWAEEVGGRVEWVGGVQAGSWEFLAAACLGSKLETFKQLPRFQEPILFIETRQPIWRHQAAEGPHVLSCGITRS